MGEVVILDLVTKIDLPPERILNGALEHGMEEVIVLGFDKNGEFYFAANKSDGGRVLWLLELAKKELMKDRS